MTGATAANWAMQWTYDEFGNRLTQTETGDPVPPPMTLTYNQSTNRITTTGYQYDNNGNLEHIPATPSMPEISNITWDLFDRMTQATVNGTTTQYKYDAMGRRMARGGERRVIKPRPTDLGGCLLATYPGSNPNQLELTRYFAGQKLGQWADRVGSTRYATDGVVSHYCPYPKLVPALKTRLQRRRSERRSD